MIKKLPLLPIGTQTFSTLREDNYLYIDKTEYIYNLINNGRIYFLSRPRRFGKSLLISTLEKIFEGKREYFKDLWIDKSDYHWNSYPVIRIDMSLMNNDNPTIFKEELFDKLHKVASIYGVEIDTSKNYQAIFRDLIELLSKNNKVVILIDEYDAPIINNITKPEIANEMRDILRNFYGVIKGSDQYIKFVLLTGVSKFSKMSVFSGLNHLEDISMNSYYSAMLGYTQEELEYYFKDYIDLLVLNEGEEKSNTLEKIKHWYNGYYFSEDKKNSVYNPFSTLLLFKNNRFSNYWFETGTPKFLVDLIKDKEFKLGDNSKFVVSGEAFSSYEIDNLSVLPLLYQTGYLTIQSYNKEAELFTLDYPNYEVKRSFVNSLLSSYTDVEAASAPSYIYELKTSLNTYDLENFFKYLRYFFARIPYDIQLNNEYYYQTIFHLIFTMIGIDIKSEVRTNQGRIDCVIETTKYIYIFEFKLNGTKLEALQQIKDKNYADKYKGGQKNIVLVGAEFDRETRSILDSGWIIETI